jgi:hypothetical protein
MRPVTTAAHSFCTAKLDIGSCTNNHMLLAKRNRQAERKLLIILYLLPKVRNYKWIFLARYFRFSARGMATENYGVKMDYSGELE